MSSAAWPVWGAALGNLRTASKDVERRGLYRLPVVYRHAVQFIVALVIVYDVFVLGTVVGRLFYQSYEYAWFSSVLATITMVFLVTMVTLLVGVCEDMEGPFGADPTDLTGLSYVAAAAEKTLRMIAPAGSGKVAAARACIMSGVEDLFEQSDS